ncbi:SapC family protein [Chlorobium sp. BLA1]|uniref:SapC family protein n=1 Tax=Candidatus Chlorobium masyuteum TaxID=2716876 RepID=UPI001422BDDF|nr:SapC family protein [Candidatus Chlorobium masyuteum]NHQ61116.1 SapC family protein [Candidatus Chlorobium masyuteum]
MEQNIPLENLPLFYSRPIPLNREAHASLTVSPSPEGYRYAASARTVLLATAEFFDAGRFYPIIFSNTSDNAILPVALLGLEENENLFVDDEGAWHGRYIPAYIRRYPFITTDGTEGQTTVCFDEDFDGFNLEGGLPLFEDGEPAPKMLEIQAFLQDYLLQMDRARQFGAQLAEYGLIRAVDLQATPAEGSPIALNGLLVVDEEKLAQLSDSEVTKLFRSGALALIHAHLLSLRNVDALVERKVQGTQR